MKQNSCRQCFRCVQGKNKKSNKSKYRFIDSHFKRQESIVWKITTWNKSQKKETWIFLGQIKTDDTKVGMLPMNGLTMNQPVGGRHVGEKVGFRITISVTLFNNIITFKTCRTHPVVTTVLDSTWGSAVHSLFTIYDPNMRQTGKAWLTLP